MTLEERIELARAAHRDVWTTEPFTRTPINERVAREAASKAAYNDSKQDLGKMIT